MAVLQIGREVLRRNSLNAPPRRRGPFDRTTILKGGATPPKRMQMTKLRPAPERQDKVPPCAPAGKLDGGTASQLIVRRESTEGGR